MLIIDRNQITYELSLLEKLGAFSRSPSADVSNLISITREENPWTSKVLRGMRAPGTGIPYVIMLGTMRHRGGKDFCVIYKKRPVLVLEFKDERYKRWVIPASNSNSSVVESLGSR